jgi:hypothetical protein
MSLLRAARLAAAGATLAGLAGCAPFFGEYDTVHTLNDRLATRLAADVADRDLAYTRAPGGARVTLIGPALFTPEGALTEHGREVLTRVAQALVEPAFMTVQPAGPGGAADPRVRTVQQFFTDAGLGGMLVASGAAPGEAVTLSVVPPRYPPPGVFPS